MTNPTVSLEGTQVMMQLTDRRLTLNTTAAAGITAGNLVWQDASGGFTVVPVAQTGITADEVWVALETTVQNEPEVGVRGRVRVKADSGYASLTVGVQAYCSQNTAGYVGVSGTGTSFVVGTIVTAPTASGGLCTIWMGDPA